MARAGASKLKGSPRTEGAAGVFERKFVGGLDPKIDAVAPLNDEEATPLH